MRGLSRTRWSLLQAARAGDEQAVADLVAKYRPAIVGYAACHGLAGEAEDLAQEVLVGLLSQGALERFDPRKGKFRTWLRVITRNQLNRHLERRYAQKRGGGAQPAPLDDIDVAAPGEDDAFDREWFGNLLRLALERLAEEHPGYHAAVRHFVQEGLSYEETAAALGKSRTAVKNAIYRGKRKLAAYLQEEVWGYSASRPEYEAEVRTLSRYLKG